jgi:general stress protein YciG
MEQGNNNNNNTTKRTANRGFASMNPEQQRQIAKKGGETVSQDRKHMAEIGRKGGESSGASRSANRNAQNKAKQNSPEGENREDRS